MPNVLGRRPKGNGAETSLWSLKEQPPKTAYGRHTQGKSIARALGNSRNPPHFQLMRTRGSNVATPSAASVPDTAPALSEAHITPRTNRPTRLPGAVWPPDVMRCIMKHFAYNHIRDMRYIREITNSPGNVELMDGIRNGTKEIRWVLLHGRDQMDYERCIRFAFHDIWIERRGGECCYRYGKYGPER